MKPLKFYLQKARKEKFAIPQFNFSDFNQLKAIVETAVSLKAPVILGTSEGESKFFGIQEAVALRDALIKKYKTPLFLNLDHGKSYDYVKEAADAGYDMIHFDGSKLSLEENMAISKKVVAYAKKKGILVEGEMGRIGTDASRMYSEKFEIKEENLTKPEEAQSYIKKTGVDLLAISVGNFHGIEVSGHDPHLRLDLLKRIQEAVGDSAMLVLHGGSGTPTQDIKEAIRLGIVKININTELRLAYASSLRKALIDNKEEIVPYKFFQEPRKSVQEIASSKIALFGCGGKA